MQPEIVDEHGHPKESGYFVVVNKSMWTINGCADELIVYYSKTDCVVFFYGTFHTQLPGDYLFIRKLNLAKLEGAK